MEVEDPNAQPDEEYVYTIDHEVNVADLSQSGCEVNKIKEKKTAREWDPRTHESLMMVDSGASVNVCPKWFGNSKLEQSDDATERTTVQATVKSDTVLKNSDTVLKRNAS